MAKRLTDENYIPISDHAVGMIGVFSVAVELLRLGFTVAPTSRNAAGADLLVMDQKRNRAWSVEVKTSSEVRPTWQVNENVINSKSHVFVFVNLNGDGRPKHYKVVSSAVVAAHLRGRKTPSGRCYFHKSDGPPNEGWELFSEPGTGTLAVPA